MSLAEIILAIMLTLQPAGRTVYSAVPVVDGVVCDSEFTRGCRRETADEGTVRYWTIAQAIAAQDAHTAPWLVTIGFAESGWRRDTHGDVGKWARGDHGAARTLWQFNVGRSRKAKVFDTGFIVADVVGTDYEHTENAAEAAAMLVGRAVKACRAQPLCVFSRYGGVPKNAPLVVKNRIASRVRIYHRVRNMLAKAPELDAHVRELLHLDGETGS